MVDVSPLTKLPGNIAILKQVQGRLQRGEKFALAYCDLDHFKPFNDRYGFGRGDEVIKMVGRLILNNVLEAQPVGSFVFPLPCNRLATWGIEGSAIARDKCAGPTF